MVAVIERRRRLRRAGRAAHEKYELETKAWRRKNRRFFWSVTAIVAVVVLGSLLVGAPRNLTAWLAGVVGGMALMFLIAVRDSPPGWIENYRRGAWGEERTAKVLEPLTRRGWVVLHDLRWDKGNFDHVIIGPGGIFALDTKNWRGEARFDGRSLSVLSPGSHRPASYPQIAGATRAQAAQLHDWLERRGAGWQWVNAAVVLWTDFEQQRATGSNIAFVHGDHLVSWLEELPARLNAKQVSDLAALLQPGQRRRPRSDEYELASD